MEATEETKTYEVIEIHGGSTAKDSGWDFTVCRSLKEALYTLESDIDALGEGEEITVRFKRYSPAQMDDVVFEN